MNIANGTDIHTFPTDKYILIATTNYMRQWLNIKGYEQVLSNYMVCVTHNRACGQGVAHYRVCGQFVAHYRVYDHVVLHYKVCGQVVTHYSLCVARLYHIILCGMRW